MEEAIPKFDVIPPDVADAVRPFRRARRNWRPVIEALTAGRTLFLPDTDLGDSDVKYLQLALARRGRREYLRTVRSLHKGQSGRMLEVVVTPVAGATMPVTPT